MKARWCKHALLTLLVLQAIKVSGGVEPVDFVVMGGYDFIANSNNTGPITTFGHQVTHFNANTFSFPSTEQVRKINNSVQLYLDPNYPQYIGFPYTLEVIVDIVKYEVGSSATSTETATLVINYDPVERTRWIEKACFNFTNSGKVVCNIQSVKFLQTTPLSPAQIDDVVKVLGFRINMEIERYYIFDHAIGLTGTQVSSFFDNTNHKLTIRWDAMLGAEYYDLEWAYVDDYGVSNASTLQLGKHFDLNRNATRIQTTDEEYTFPIVYEKGYILYRVRGVGMKYDAVTDKLYLMQGRWSNPATSSPTGPEQAANVTAWTHKFQIPNPFESDKMNWQIITSYAEEGKNKSVVTVRDGTDRTRQTITGLSTENQAMVAEKIFDHQGRAAIEVLPVPTNDPTLKYYKLFNRTSAGAPYTRADFDITTTSCTLIPGPMHTSSGASRYYSSNNLYQHDENAYIPDAKGYPFIQTEFTPDNTGRIRRQSGVGIHHRLGSDHETKYFYGTPAQEEISMLFGIEVGEADHYKKNVVQDPNGQLSVSYLDLKGKVIATALAGNPPANLDTLPSYDSIQMDIDLMVFNQKDSIHNELIATRTFTVTHKSNYQFSYSMSNQPYVVNLCNVKTLCYDCVYDLEIHLIDNDSCNTIKLQEIKGINPVFNTLGQVNVDNSCPKGATTFTFDYNDNPSFSKILKVGSYTIEKRLRVNQAATEEYVNDYLEEFEVQCKAIYDDTLKYFLSKVDSAACDLKDSSKALNRCDVAREAMLLDMRPGGQYGAIDYTFIYPSYTSADQVSVYNPNNELPQNTSSGVAYWKNPSLVYRDANGVLDSIYNAQGTKVPPNHSSITLKEFADNFQDSWAKQLLQFHPEYCYLQWCERDSASFDYDVILAETATFSEAVSKGYMSSTFPLDPILILNKDPYFAQPGPGQAGGGGAALYGGMQNNITIYYQASGTPIYSMLHAAVWAELLKYPVYPTFGNNPSPPNIVPFANVQGWIDGTAHPLNPMVEDTVWQRFRAMYLAKKEQLQYEDRWWYAMHTCANYGGYNECIAEDYFNYFKHGFGSWMHNGLFYSSSQTCSRYYFSLYKDKGIRFPSVYNIPVDFDPYAPPADILGDMSQWADSLTTSICEKCQCTNDEFTQFLNWIIANQFYNNPNVFVPLMPNFMDMAWYQKLKKCFGSGINQIRVIDNLGSLVIEFMNSSGNSVASIVLNTGISSFDWKSVSSFKCVFDAKIYNGIHSGKSKLLLTNGQVLTIYVHIDPPCFVWNECEKAPSCPPNNLSIQLSQLFNAFIAADTLVENFVATSYVGRDLYSYFRNGEPVTRPIRWIGTWSNTTLKVSLGGNINCQFEFEFPAGFTQAELKDLGPVISFVPDVSKIDPATGYTFYATLKVMIRNDKNPIVIKVKSSCFPFSYCLKCPPPPKTQQVYKMADQKKNGQIKDLAKKDSDKPLGPVTHPKNIYKIEPEPIATSIDSGEVVDTPQSFTDPVGPVFIPDFPIILNPKKDCFPCDPSLFTTKYDSLKADGSVVTVTTKPSPTACDPCSWSNDTLPWLPFPNPCLQEQVMAAYANAANAYQIYLDSIVADFRNEYIRHCLSAAETFSLKYTDALHHFTLYYYDQANNLIKTIPPEGVHPLNATQTKQAILKMRNQGGVAIVPPHTMPSDYKFNSLNQLIEQTIPDHTGKSEFFYDYLGRIVVSQNPEQRVNSNYSYTKYDPHNRPVETGELLNVPANNIMTHAKARDFYQLPPWINTFAKREVTTTTYDAQSTAIANLHFNGHRNNYRGRIAAVSHEEKDGSPVVNSTYYKYDIHGKVKELVQDVYQIGPKKLIYQYDLISGSVKEVHYQPGEVDQYMHRYAYDADNRIKYVWTSFDGMVWDRDAKYQYYAHGPLARTELGENNVQGIDFAYTIQGWIKGVNSGALRDKIDMGRDGDFGGQHGMVAEDAFGYMLRYFTDDYQMIGPTQSGINWEPTYSGTPFWRANRDLFNGNIQSMITALQEPVNTPTPIGPMGYAYTYDQLNRITNMKAFNSLDRQGNLWTGAQSIDDYACHYTYDANGNLGTLTRNGVSPILDMDKLTYHYYPGRNQLAFVKDPVLASNYPDDIEGQPTNNYLYDRIGNLIYEQGENLGIAWNAAGKVKTIDKFGTGEHLSFSYDATGKRVIKTNKNNVTQKTESTYYVLDATGNVMAMYSKVQGSGVANNGLKLSSFFMYGSSRLGEERIDSSLADLVKAQAKTKAGFYSFRSRGSKYFELGNHLGNVLATVSDRSLQFDNNGNDGIPDEYLADIWTVNDYYPFGAGMLDRDFNSGDFRYAFNGKEQDKEIKGFGNSFDFGERIYDPRVAKWLSIDPLQKKYPEESPYNFSGNCPISIVDDEGMQKIYYITKIAKDGTKTSLKIIEKYTVIQKTTYSRQSIGYGGVSFYESPQISNTETFDVAQVIVIDERNNTIMSSDPYATVKRSNSSIERGIEDNAEQLGNYLSEQFGEGGGIVFTSSEGQGQETRKAGKNTDVKSENIDLLMAAIGAAATNSGGKAKTLLDKFKLAIDAIQIAKDVDENDDSDGKKPPALLFKRPSSDSVYCSFCNENVFKDKNTETDHPSTKKNEKK